MLMWKAFFFLKFLIVFVKLYHKNTCVQTIRLVESEKRVVESEKAEMGWVFSDI